MSTILHNKAQHFIYGVVITLLTQVAVSAAGLQFAPYVWALGASVIIGGVKEIYDWVTGQDNPWVADFYWTAIGGLVVALPGVI